MIKRIPFNFYTALAMMVLAANSAYAQSVIVLRDLTLIKDQAVESFDRAAIELTDGTQLSWDKILRADVEKERQQEFNRNIAEIGLPIFRLKSRIKLGDWPGAGLIAEPLFEKQQAIENSPLSKYVEYLVGLATMKSRIRAGNRAGSVLPFLQAFEIQPHVDSETLTLVGENRLPDSPQLALSSELPPVWFDMELVAKSEKQISAAKNVGPSLGRSIYLASMNIELDQTDAARILLDQIEGSNSKPAKPWSVVLRARILQRAGDHVKCDALLDRNANNLTGDVRPVAIYYRALSGMQIQTDADANIKNEASDVELSRSALMLLRIPAIYGKQHPDLAAAAIFQAAKIAELRERPNEAEKLTKQLLRHHPHTYHGSIAAAQSGKIQAR